MNFDRFLDCAQITAGEALQRVQTAADLSGHIEAKCV